MKSVQGLLFIGVALFLIWLGVTGRFEKIAVAIGVLRSQPTPLPGAGGSIYPAPIGPGLDTSSIYPRPIGPGLP